MGNDITSPEFDCSIRFLASRIKYPSVRLFFVSLLPKGLPGFFPCDLALRNPSIVRSRISSRSNSATPARMLYSRRPMGVLVSTAMSRITRSTPSASNSAARLHRCRVERARRSSFVQTMALISRLRAASINSSSAGAERLLEDLQKAVHYFESQPGHDAVSEGSHFHH